MDTAWGAGSVLGWSWAIGLDGSNEVKYTGQTEALDLRSQGLGTTIGRERGSDTYEEVLEEDSKGDQRSWCVNNNWGLLCRGVTLPSLGWGTGSAAQLEPHSSGDRKLLRGLRKERVDIEVAL